MNAADLPDETLFEGVLKCCTPEEERASYLNRACAGQPALRRRMEELLAAQDASGEFLEPTVAANRPTLTFNIASDEMPGRTVGPIGQDGTGPQWS